MNEAVVQARGGNGTRVPSPDARLRGWKEIGRWFGVDERTVKRWEAARGLPIRRVPGEPRAPVFAYETELAAWLQSGGAREAEAEPAPESSGDAAPVPAGLLARHPRFMALAGAVLFAALLLAWLGWQAATDRQQAADDRVADVRQLAQAQVAALSDRLERQPGTVQLREGLARDAAAVLARVAALPDASPVLRQEAAEAYRRLAAVQSATDRPSLRDRAAARATLETALGLVADDRSAAAGRLRARILIDAARHAAADGALARAPALLAAAEAAAARPPPALREELLLAQSEVAQWQAAYPLAIARADAVKHALPGDADGWLRQVRAHDLAAEAHYYAGDKAAAAAGYRTALAAATAGAARFADQPAFRWAVQRQQWNLGSTLLAMGDTGAALPLLAASRTGWLAMAAADPADGSLAAWVRTTRLSYGEGLAAAGRRDDAIAELSRSLAERRVWLAGHPANAEAQRQLIVGLNALADVLGEAGRRGEACGLIAEAVAATRQMAGAGSLTGLDKGSIGKQLADSSQRYCPGVAMR